MTSRSRTTDSSTDDGFSQLYDDVFKSFVDGDVDISSHSLGAGIPQPSAGQPESYSHDYIEDEPVRHPYSSAISPQLQSIQLDNSPPRSPPLPPPPPPPPLPQTRQSLPQSPRQQQPRRPLPRPPASDPSSAASSFFPLDKKQPIVNSPVSESYPYGGDLSMSDPHITRSFSLSPHQPHHHPVARHGTYAAGLDSSRFNNSAPQFNRPPGAAMPTPPGGGYFQNGNGLHSYSDGLLNSSKTSLTAPSVARNTSFGSGSVSSGQYSLDSPVPHSIHHVQRAITDSGSAYERDSFYGSASVDPTDFNDDTTIGPEATITPATSISRGNSFVASISNNSGSPAEESPTTAMRPPPASVQSPATPVHRHHQSDSNRHAESSRAARHQEELQRTIASIKSGVPIPEDDDDFDDDIDEDPDRFVMLSLLSHLAVRLRDKVPRGTHVKSGIPYHRAFTGKDIVSTIQSQIQRELLINMGISTNDRRIALGVARSLQSQLFFYEVEWGGRQLTDSVEDVYMFLDDQEGVSNELQDQEELPTAVITILTKCYSLSCSEGLPCYSSRCPRRAASLPKSLELPVEAPEKSSSNRWSDSVDPQILNTLPSSEIKRQTVIRKVVEKEEQYVQDLDIIESLFIKPLRTNDPPVIPPEELDNFIDTVFGNVLDLRECNRRLLETMYVRQREQAPIIQRIGDIFLTAAAEFRLPYPDYVGHLPLAEKRMKDELENNQEFRRFHETCTRHPSARRFDLRHFITRPSEHLQRYPVLLEAIYKDTTDGNPDADFLQEAIHAIRKLSGAAHVRTFQTAMLRGPTAKLEWHDLVSSEVRDTMTKQEVTRQSQIFELIKGEMEYVKDLENIEAIFIQPLRKASQTSQPIIPRERLLQFIEDVFYNFGEILKHHKRMLEKLHEIQLEEHPVINSITATIFDAALNWRDAYMDFIPHYPIAAYRIDEELANNPAFKVFVEQATRHAESRKLDIKAFVYRPIPRLLRYDLLLKGIISASPPDHEDKEAIPQVLEVIKALGRDSEPGVVSAKQKVELWKYNANLVFKPGEIVDMDLLDESRALIHAGKLLRQADAGFEWNGWSELFVLLFDNYMVMTKPKERDGVMKYHVSRRPIPLDLLNPVNFTDPPQTRGTGILRGLRGGERGGRGGVGPTTVVDDVASVVNADAATDSRAIYPCTIHHNGRMGGLYTLYAESAQSRAEWKTKLDEALVLRKTVTDNNKVFELETLSSDTFLFPSLQNQSNAAWNQEQVLTGKVTCSVPFSTADGMRLVAVGCAEGVWIGLRHDSKSLRRVLHLKAVTQCAMLEDFGIFLVLADKSLWAYHIEALVPSGPPRPNLARTPQKLNNHKDVQFFSVGTMNGRTLLIYMKRRGTESIFHVLEPVGGKIADKPKAPATFGRNLFGSQRSDWFRHYREFFLPTEASDVVFLKNRIAVLCARGFEIMELSDYTSVSIPQREDPRLAALAKRCESSRPLGMCRTGDNEFLLCYDEFGLYVDRFGDPCRPSNNIIEWEGTAERVAFHLPHVCLFDPRFIEIRDIDTGRLAQIIHGTEIRCIWDGRGTNVPQSGHTSGTGWQDNPGQEPRIHAVMRAPEEPRAPGVRALPVFTQQVVELVPTIPLYLPGSLASPPSTATYFGHNSSSPPNSPRPSTARWR